MTFENRSINVHKGVFVIKLSILQPFIHTNHFLCGHILVNVGTYDIVRLKKHFAIFHKVLILKYHNV